MSQSGHELFPHRLYSRIFIDLRRILLKSFVSTYLAHTFIKELNST